MTNLFKPNPETGSGVPGITNFLITDPGIENLIPGLQSLLIVGQSQMLQFEKFICIAFDENFSCFSLFSASVLWQKGVSAVVKMPNTPFTR